GCGSSSSAPSPSRSRRGPRRSGSPSGRRPGGATRRTSRASFLELETRPEVERQLVVRHVDALIRNASDLTARRRVAEVEADARRLARAQGVANGDRRRELQRARVLAGLQPQDIALLPAGREAVVVDATVGKRRGDARVAAIGENAGSE